MFQPRLIWENPYRRPARACEFSGCKEPKDRRVGRWDLCRKHADNLEKSEAGRIR